MLYELVSGDLFSELFVETLYYCIFQTIRCTPPKIWEENGGASYSLNIAYLARRISIILE